MFNISELIYEKNELAPEKRETYREVLEYVRDYINTNHKGELTGDLTKDIVKDRYKVLIQQIIQEQRLHVKGCTEAKLIELLYNSMAKFDFLTPYLEGYKGDGVLPYDPLYETWEEINCNRFDDVEIVVEGKHYKLEKAFETPESCVDLVRRMARLGGLTLDKSNPRGNSYLGNGIRIIATVPPCIDSDAGATFSIRRQKSITNSKNFFLDNETADEDELDFVPLMVNNGISVCFVGRTRSGKTADINYVLCNVDGRIYTIEDTRELNLVRKDKDGRYISRVVHMVTRQSADKKQEVTAEDLVKDALRYDPDIIGLGEMRGNEAKATIASGGTDHTIVTGTHAFGPKSAFRRIATLYMDAGTNLSESMVYQNITEAIPIIVHKRVFKTGERRYMSISEAILSPDVLNPKITFNTIFRYIVEGFDRDSEGKPIKVRGSHQKVGNLSPRLAQRLFENGVELSIIRKYAGEDFTPGEDIEL